MLIPAQRIEARIERRRRNERDIYCCQKKNLKTCTLLSGDTLSLTNDEEKREKECT
jgi:hypothetical protein